MTSTCPECGHTFHSSDATEAQARIADLETQVRLLNSKASSYLDKLADYEDEVQSLRAQCAELQKERKESISVAPLQTSPAPKEDVSLPPPIPEKDNVAQRQIQRQSLSRLSSLTSYLPGRRKDEAPPMPPPNTTLNQSPPNLTTTTAEYMKSQSPPRATDPGRQGQPLTLIGLQTSLETERNLRQQAETNLAQSQTELEELTAQLFGQANEMVATERKARAKLEERVKLLETRDGDKRKRLDRLETAVQRIERVRKMVVEHEKEMGDDAYVAVEVPARRDTQKVGRTAAR
jgi:septal ring factor EnvC (AmiA/AmiB activator)